MCNSLLRSAHLMKPRFPPFPAATLLELPTPATTGMGTAVYYGDTLMTPPVPLLAPYSTRFMLPTFRIAMELETPSGHKTTRRRFIFPLVGIRFAAQMPFPL